MAGKQRLDGCGCESTEASIDALEMTATKKVGREGAIGRDRARISGAEPDDASRLMLRLLWAGGINMNGTKESQVHLDRLRDKAR
jgi:hypothetical protein